MKRIVSILLVVVMTFSLAACGSNADAPKETEGGSAAAEKETAETEKGFIPENTQAPEPSGVVLEASPVSSPC